VTIRRGIRKAKRLVRNQMPLSRPRGLILMYHRIATAKFDPWSLCVSEASFASQLEVLSTRYFPMSLNEFLEAWRRNDLPRRAVAVTFDDGYKDNYTAALPALQRACIPATIFVTTNILEDGQPLWWEELSSIFNSGINENSNLTIGVDENRRTWRYVDQAAGSAAGRRTFDSVWEYCLEQKDLDRRQLMDSIRNWAHDHGSSALVVPEMLSHKELQKLAIDSSITIGSHTVSHPYMSLESIEDNRDQLTKSREILESIVGYTVSHFAYPYGNYSENLIELLSSAGYSSACLAGGGPINNRSHPLQLPRLAVPDCGGGEFDKLLQRHL